MDRVLEGLLAIHTQEVPSIGHRLRRRRTGTAAAGKLQQAGFRAIRSEARRQKTTGTRPMLQDGSTSTVTEEHARVAVGPIHHRTHLFGTDDEHCLMRTGLDESGTNIQGIDKPTAGGLNVKRHGPVSAQFLLHQAGGARERHVRGDGGDDDQVDIGGRDPGGSHRATGRLQCHVRSCFVGSSDTTLADTGATGDPFIRSLHHPLQLSIAHHPFRHIGTETHDGGRTKRCVMGSGMVQEIL